MRRDSAYIFAAAVMMIGSVVATGMAVLIAAYYLGVWIAEAVK